MPNIKSAKKRVKVTKVKALNNQSAKSARSDGNIINTDD